MSRTRLVRVTCDAPGCGISVVVESSRTDDAPEGWAVHERSISAIHGCPGEHAETLKAAVKAAYAHEAAEFAARNRWIDKNPAPKLPKWLRGVS